MEELFEYSILNIYIEILINSLISFIEERSRDIVRGDVS